MPPSAAVLSTASKTTWMSLMNWDTLPQALPSLPPSAGQVLALSPSTPHPPNSSLSMLISCNPGTSIRVGIVAPIFPACPASAQNRCLLNAGSIPETHCQHTAEASMGWVNIREPADSLSLTVTSYVGWKLVMTEGISNSLNTPSGVGGVYPHLPERWLSWFLLHNLQQTC